MSGSILHYITLLHFHLNLLRYPSLANCINVTGTIFLSGNLTLLVHGSNGKFRGNIADLCGMSFQFFAFWHDRAALKLCRFLDLYGNGRNDFVFLLYFDGRWIAIFLALRSSHGVKL